MSDTPRTDANYVCHYGDGLGQWVPREFACELERELAAVENEMQVMSDKLSCALLEARENMEIANEFKHTMEEYRQREATAYIALREAAGLLSTTPKFSCETPEYIMEYLLNAPREKNGG